MNYLLFIIHTVFVKPLFYSQTDENKFYNEGFVLRLSVPVYAGLAVSRKMRSTLPKKMCLYSLW